MKIFSTVTTGSLAFAVFVLTVSSCQKKFDSNTYKPSKPLPSYGGYSATKDIEPTSLVAYWPFSNSLADSLSSTTGVAASTSFTAGVAGQGLQGADKGYVLSDVPTSVKSLHSFTLSTWVKMPQNTAATGIIDLQNNQPGDPGFWGAMAIFFDNGGSATTGILKVHLFSKPGSTDGKDAWEGGYTVANPWNTWINITVSYNDETSTVGVYYNGTKVGTNTVSGFVLDWSTASKMVFGTLQFQTTPSLTVSTGAQDWAGYVTGTMDQVRIYNKVLTITEIGAMYSLEKAGR